MATPTNINLTPAQKRALKRLDKGWQTPWELNSNLSTLRALTSKGLAEIQNGDNEIMFRKPLPEEPK